MIQVLDERNVPVAGLFRDPATGGLVVNNPSALQRYNNVKAVLDQKDARLTELEAKLEQLIELVTKNG
jgi:hypothetical protein